MSLNVKNKLSQVAKELARELRRNSTPAEKIMWGVLRNRKFCDKKFYRQYPIYFDNLGNETFFIADFYSFEEKLVIEIDGGYHKRQMDYDQLRTDIINSLGIKVIRFTNEQVTNELKNVLEIIKQNIEAK